MGLPGTLRRGFLAGLRVVWEVGKVLVPAAAAIAVLEQAGLLPRVAGWFAPAMGLFGLPGETALVLVVGNGVGFYAGLGVLAGLALPTRQATIAAAMLMICHSSIMEVALMVRAGARPGPVVTARVVAAVLAGAFLNLFLGA